MTQSLTDREHVDAALEAARPFLEHLVCWEDALEPVRLDDLMAAAGGPDHVAIISVDLIRGFVEAGPLASERVAAVVVPVRRLLLGAHARGIRHFAFLQDAHPPDSPEFAAFPPQCVEGTTEAEMVDPLATLPFAGTFCLLSKTSVDGSVGTGLSAWLQARPDVRCFIVVGDCTDICLYHIAMHLKVRANVARRPEVRVIVPADCAATYHLSVAQAAELGAIPHDGDLLHRVFLHQMALNGVTVVSSVLN